MVYNREQLGRVGDNFICARGFYREAVEEDFKRSIDRFKNIPDDVKDRIKKNGNMVNIEILRGVESEKPVDNGDGTCTAKIDNPTIDEGYLMELCWEYIRVLDYYERFKSGDKIYTDM